MSASSLPVRARINSNALTIRGKTITVWIVDLQHIWRFLVTRLLILPTGVTVPPAVLVDPGQWLSTRRTIADMCSLRGGHLRSNLPSSSEHEVCDQYAQNEGADQLDRPEN